MPWKVKHRSHSEEQAHARSFVRRLSFKKRATIATDVAASVKLIIYAEQASMPMSGRIVTAMARKLTRELKILHQSCPPFARNDWLRHFLVRYNLHPKRSHGEIGSVDVEAAMQPLETVRDRMRQFHSSNVYNMDETALYYKATPRTPVVLKKAPALKQDKSRVTMVVGANVDGTDKLPLVFLGKAANPRWLAGKPACDRAFPCHAAQCTERGSVRRAPSTRTRDVEEERAQLAYWAERCTQFSVACV